MNPLITKSLLLLSAKLGPSPTPQRVLEVLQEVGIANEVDMRAYIIGREFFDLYRMPDNRTARDIEEELAAQYDLTREGVCKIRLRYAQRIKRGTMGRPKKA